MESVKKLRLEGRIGLRNLFSDLIWDQNYVNARVPAGLVRTYTGNVGPNLFVVMDRNEYSVGEANKRLIHREVYVFGIERTLRSLDILIKEQESGSFDPVI